MVWDYIPVIIIYGVNWPPVSILVGLVFILRDYAQLEVGHKIILVMLAGAAISCYMATPQIAFASMTAFLVSETIDYLIFTFTKKPFEQRVLFSSLVSTPIDTGVFLTMANFFSYSALISMTLGKLLGAAIVFIYLKKKANKPWAGPEDQKIQNGSRWSRTTPAELPSQMVPCIFRHWKNYQ